MVRAGRRPYAYGHSARFDAQAQRLTWPDAAARIARLLEEGRYATREELTEAPGYARRTLARSLRYLYYDIASREQAEQAFPLLATLTDGSFAEDMQRLDQALADRDFCAALSEELAAFRDALREHRAAALVLPPAGQHAGAACGVAPTAARLCQRGPGDAADGGVYHRR